MDVGTAVILIIYKLAHVLFFVVLNLVSGVKSKPHNPCTLNQEYILFILNAGIVEFKDHFIGYQFSGL